MTMSYVNNIVFVCFAHSNCFVLSFFRSFLFTFFFCSASAWRISFAYLLLFGCGCGAWNCEFHLLLFLLVQHFCILLFVCARFTLEIDYKRFQSEQKNKNEFNSVAFQVFFFGEIWPMHSFCQWMRFVCKKYKIQSNAKYSFSLSFRFVLFLHVAMSIYNLPLSWIECFSFSLFFIFIHSLVVFNVVYS